MKYTTKVCYNLSVISFNAFHNFGISAIFSRLRKNVFFSPFSTHWALARFCAARALCCSRTSSFSWAFSRLRWVTVPWGAAPSAVSRSLSSLYRGTNALFFFFFSSSLFYLLCVIENSLICSFNNSHNVWLSVSLSSMKDSICSFI